MKRLVRLIGIPSAMLMAMLLVSVASAAVTIYRYPPLGNSQQSGQLSNIDWCGRSYGFYQAVGIYSWYSDTKMDIGSISNVSGYANPAPDDWYWWVTYVFASQNVWEYWDTWPRAFPYYTSWGIFYPNVTADYGSSGGVVVATNVGAAAYPNGCTGASFQMALWGPNN